MLLLHPLFRPPPHLARQRPGHVLRQPERLADLAHRPARPIADHGGAQRRPVPSVMVINPLDHLLAPLVLEVDVDIRRLVPLRRNEPLEQQPGAGRVDAGDPQHITNCRIGRRPPPLAQDALAPRVADDAVHRQEIRRVVELPDQRQLMRELAPHPLRHAVLIALTDPLPDQPLQRLLRREPRLLDLVGILILELPKVEPAALDQLDRARDRVGMPGEQPRHLLRRLEMPVREPLPPEPGRIDRAPLADAGHHVLQHPPLRVMEQHVPRREQRNPLRRPHRRQPMQPHLVPRPPPHGAGKIRPPGRIRAQPVELRLRAARPARPERAHRSARPRPPRDPPTQDRNRPSQPVPCPA